MNTKLLLRDNQKAALAKLLNSGDSFGALWAEPRSGKTAVALAWVKHFKPKVVVVVAPKIAELVWKAEVNKWVNKNYMFFPLTKGNIYPSLTEIFADNSLVVLFVNYEQFAKTPFKRLKPFLHKISHKLDGKGAMILDESHKIKTPSSVIGRNIRPLAKEWEYRLIMTGTPVTNPTQIDSVYGQWCFVDPSIRDKWSCPRAFREHFGEWSTVKGFPELIRPKNQAELVEYLSPHVATITTSTSNVPVKKVKYNLPDSFRDEVQSFMKDGVRTFYGHTVTGLNPLTRLIRARQITAGWCIDDRDKKFVVKISAQHRLHVLKQLLATLDGKVIVCCSHLYEIDLVTYMLKKSGIHFTVVTGAVKDKDDALDSFRYQDANKVLVVQPVTVSMAVDISVANYIIWYSSDFNFVTFKQTNDRIKLSPANPVVYFIQANNSVDEDVYTTLVKDHQHLKKVMQSIRAGDYM